MALQIEAGEGASELINQMKHENVSNLLILLSMQGCFSSTSFCRRQLILEYGNYFCIV